MKLFRIYLTSWTCSFRYPNMISGFQPTLMVPPLSTMNGLISAAMGKYFALTIQRFGFVFCSSGKTVDLETIYQIGHSGVKSNVIKRELLIDNHLWMYTDSEEIKNAFERPVYPLLFFGFSVSQ